MRKGFLGVLSFALVLTALTSLAQPVSGPLVSTNRGVPIFSQTNGKKIDPSPVYIDATGNLYFGGPGTVIVNDMTTAERNLLSATNGMVIYNTTTATAQVRQAGAWVDLATVGGTGVVAPNITALAALDPAISGVATVLGYYSPFDGGGGTFYGTNTIAGTNIGTRIFTPFSASWHRLDQGPMNVRWFGARGNGTSNDTPAFTAVYDSIKTNGGAMFVPFTTNAWVYNLAVTNDNIGILGEGGNVATGTNNVSRPWDTTRPVIQVGNDTGYAKRFSMHRMAIFAERGGTNSPGAIHLLGGAEKAQITQSGFLGGADTIKLMGGATYPSELNRFIQCEAWEGTNSTINAIYPQGGSYTTGNSFNDGHVNGHNTSGFAVRIDGGRPISFDSTYFDMEDNHGFYLTNFPAVKLQNGFTEVASGVGLFTIDYRPLTNTAGDFSLTRFVEAAGDDLQGTVVFWDAVSTNSVAIPSPGWHNVFRYTSMFDPFVETRINFTTPNAPGSSIFQIQLAGTNDIVPLQMFRTDLHDSIFQYYGTNTFLKINGPTNVNRIFATDFENLGTNAGGIEWFRNTITTNELYHDLHVGNGTFSRNVHLSANSNTWINAMVGNVGIGTSGPTYRLHVKGPDTGQLALEGTNNAFIDFYSHGLGAGNNGAIGYWETTGTTNFMIWNGEGWIKMRTPAGVRFTLENDGLTIAGFVYGNTVYPANVGASKAVRTDSAGKLAEMTIGANLTFDGTTLSATGGGVGNGSGSLQNATAIGGGANYSITDTFALVNFGSGDPSLTLPAAGRYLLVATLSGESANTFQKDFAFRDTTAGVYASTNNIATMVGSGYWSVAIHSVYESPGANTIQLWSKMNDPAYTGTHEVWSTNTTFTYIRLDGVLGFNVNAASVSTPNFQNTAATGTVPSSTVGVTGTNFSLTIGPASATDAGVVTTGTQTLAGNKTLQGSFSATNAVNAYSGKFTNNVDVDGILSVGALASVESEINGKALVSHVHAFSALTAGSNSVQMAGNFKDSFTRKSQAGTLSGATPTVDWQTEPLKFHIVSAPITYGEANRPTSSTAGESLEIHMTNSTGSDQPIVLPSGWRDETGVGFTNLVAGKTATIYSKWNSAEVKFYWRTYEPP